MGFIIPAAVLAILALAAIIGYFVTPKTKKEREPYSTNFIEKPNPAKAGAALVAAGLITLLVALTALASVATVGAREVGVETAFGRYTRTLEQGWQFQAPWASVEKFDAKLQTTDAEAGVAFSGGGGGNQPVTVNWQITPDEAEELWRDFGNFDRVRDDLVIPATRDTIYRVMNSYTPAASLRDDNAAKIRDDVKTELNKTLAPYGITAKEVRMPRTNFDDKSNEFLNRVQQSEANLTRSEVDKKTAENEAAADEIRNREASPESLELECYDVTRTWNDDNNGPLPASWNCAGGSDVQLTKPVD